MQKNSDFPTLEIYYSNYANLKIKAIHNVCFQKPCIVTFDNYKYVSTSKSYKLQSHNITSCKKTSFPLFISQSHVKIFNLLVFPVDLPLVVL